jgi:hypothetical protein
MKSYYDVLKEYINSNLLDKSSLKHYQNMMLDVLYRLIKIEPSYYRDLIQIYISFEDYEQATFHSDDYLVHHPCEEAYIMSLSVLFQTKDKKKFDKVFNDLRNSEIDLRSDAMKLLRFWIKDVAYVEH